MPSVLLKCVTCFHVNLYQSFHVGAAPAGVPWEEACRGGLSGRPRERYVTREERERGMGMADEVKSRGKHNDLSVIAEEASVLSLQGRLSCAL